VLQDHSSAGDARMAANANYLAFLDLLQQLQGAGIEGPQSVDRRTSTGTTEADIAARPAERATKKR
jgi:hypothetical protein